jgi:C1A family cysteine protease
VKTSARRPGRRRPKNPEARILNCLPSRNPEDDWLAPDAASAGLLDFGATVPASKDLRDDGWWKVGDQGATGSCVGWATADSVIRWHLVKLRSIAKEERLSVRFTWMASKEMDEYSSRPTTFIDGAGTSLKAALDIARKYGVVPEAELPFKLGPLLPRDENAFYAVAAQMRIRSYFSLRSLSTVPMTEIWKLWIATKGPVLARLGVDETWDRAGNSGGILDVYKPDTVRGGHAVALVGYTKDRFIVRNSWGTAWGDEGYAYASTGYAAEAFTESYGVTP